ncbi:hypothetical protein L5876_00215 [Hyphobacterium sp. SN044]|uniref:hypothetical protein n=1 Tax=Hyphobacterium sp. SN044 TaxID=2912575 RepID=UPI001F2D4A0A|nr:hypothetical protein [Hyphobacterium sp. SN044]MCF8878235.1 hypothetical protein [Hyphobacterium sp. SN044]
MIPAAVFAGLAIAIAIAVVFTGQTVRWDDPSSIRVFVGILTVFLIFAAPFAAAIAFFFGLLASVIAYKFGWKSFGHAIAVSLIVALGLLMPVLLPATFSHENSERIAQAEVAVFALFSAVFVAICLATGSIAWLISRPDQD